MPHLAILHELLQEKKVLNLDVVLNPYSIESLEWVDDASNKFDHPGSPKHVHRWPEYLGQNPSI